MEIWVLVLLLPLLSNVTLKCSCSRYVCFLISEMKYLVLMYPKAPSSSLIVGPWSSLMRNVKHGSL